MEPLQIARDISEKFPEEIRDVVEFRGQVSVTVTRDRVMDILTYIKSEPGIECDYLRDLCGVDYMGKKPVRFEVVYHLYSLKHRHMIRLKAEVPEDDCSIESCVQLWAGADWHERECYDLFGIEFKGHPDHRRILLPDDWEGFPLRKDYPVEGPSLENDWPGFKEVLKTSREFREIRMVEQTKDSQSGLETRELTISMGPQHPATHGVLRLVLDLDGETVVKCTPYVGYLHRGTEKLCETKTYMTALPLMDRLDYISSMSNDVGYAVAVERLFGIKAPQRAQYIRTIVSEMTRISSHIIWLGTHALDIGAMTVFLYSFREREWLLDLLEMLTGARLTVSYPRIGGVRNDVSQEFIDSLYAFTEEFPGRLKEYETLIDQNRIWLKRTKGVGYISAEDAINWGLTGATLRGSGPDYDVRKYAPYDAYDKVDFDIPTATEGDVYARYRVRMEELRQSNRIIKQCLEQLPRGPIISPDAPKFTLPAKGNIFSDMESLIHHFVLITRGPLKAPVGEFYSGCEVPKGELGFYIVSDGTGRPYRLRLRSPSFIHASVLPKLSEGHMVADVIANIGTIDIVLGECDR